MPEVFLTVAHYHFCSAPLLLGTTSARHHFCSAPLPPSLPSSSVFLPQLSLTIFKETALYRSTRTPPPRHQTLPHIHCPQPLLHCPLLTAERTVLSENRHRVQHLNTLIHRQCTRGPACMPETPLEGRSRCSMTSRPLNRACPAFKLQTTQDTARGWIGHIRIPRCRAMLRHPVHLVSSAPTHMTLKTQTMRTLH